MKTGVPVIRAVRAGAARWLRVLPTVIALAFVSGCGPLLHETDDKTPQILLPIGYAPVTDRRARFREIYCALQRQRGHDLFNNRPCAEALAKLDGEGSATGKPVLFEKSKDKSGNAENPPDRPFHTAIVPGIFGECAERFAPIFKHARKLVEDFGYSTSVIPVGGRSSSVRNAEKIAEEVVALAEQHSTKEQKKKVLLIAYSKGVADTLTALAEDESIHEYVAGVVSVAGVVGGSPLADKLHDRILGRVADKLPHPDCKAGTDEAIFDISREKRMRWLADNRALFERKPGSDGIRFYSVVAYPEPNQVSAILKPFYNKLAQVDVRNDSQVVFSDAVIPGSALLGYVQADHWAVSLPFSEESKFLAATLVTKNAFPREVLLEAIVRFVEEDLSQTQ